MKEESLYISVSLAAKRIGVGKDTMYSMTRLEGFPCVRIGTRRVIHQERFDKWMEEHEGKEIKLK